MIRIENIEKRFKKLRALCQVSGEFHKGEVVALIGPNGSGKTTLIKTILGLVKQDSGNIYFNGTPLKKDVEYRKHIGYMPQIGRYPDNMKIGQLFKMIENVRSEETNKDHEIYYKFKLDTLSEKPMRSLSGGTRQKVSAALAFLFNPDILILDEPTAGLDPLSSEILKDKIMAEKKKGKLILITSHVLSDLEEFTTHLMYMQDGQAIFLKPIEDVRSETGEEKLSKAVASLMRNQKTEVTYLKIAR